jgi:nucleoside-diphosphate-sugar epimerase
LLLTNNYETVIHLAAKAHVLEVHVSLEEYLKVNRDQTIILAKMLADNGMKRFIYMSSIGVNGAHSSIGSSFTGKSTPNPHSDYALSKYEAEIGLKKLAKQMGFELVIIRPTLVYGPNAPGNFGSLCSLVSKSPFLPFSLINNKRDFISVQNLASLIVTCLNNPNAAGHTFLASDSQTVSIKDFTNAIAKGVGTNLIQLPVPVSLMRFAGKLLGKSTMVEQLVGNLEVDSSNLFEVLDWTPPYTMEESMSFLKQEKLECSKHD